MILISAGAFASDTAQNVGFLSDYTDLKAAKDNTLTQYYIPPGARQKLSTYKAIMVDQPQIFIAKDSPYQGIKPAQMNAITEAFRASVVKALSSDYKVVDEPGEGVLYLRLALVDLSVKKDRVHIFSYSPIGLVVSGVSKAAHSSYENAVQHMSLIGLKIEGEVLDSQSSDLLGEFVDDRGNKPNPENWKELLDDMQHFGEIVDCQLKNGRSAESDEVNCRAGG